MGIVFTSKAGCEVIGFSEQRKPLQLCILVKSQVGGFQRSKLYHVYVPIGCGV